MEEDFNNKENDINITYGKKNDNINDKFEKVIKHKYILDCSNNKSDIKSKTDSNFYKTKNKIKLSLPKNKPINNLQISSETFGEEIPYNNIKNNNLLFSQSLNESITSNTLSNIKQVRPRNSISTFHKFVPSTNLKIAYKRTTTFFKGDKKKKKLNFSREKKHNKYSCDSNDKNLKKKKHMNNNMNYFLKSNNIGISDENYNNKITKEKYSKRDIYPLCKLQSFSVDQTNFKAHLKTSSYGNDSPLDDKERRQKIKMKLDELDNDKNEITKEINKDELNYKKKNFFDGLNDQDKLLYKRNNTNTINNAFSYNTPANKQEKKAIFAKRILTLKSNKIKKSILSSVVSIPGEVKGIPCTNKDSYIIKENIFGLNFNVYGVFDGHGNNGHVISKYISDYVGTFFCNRNYFENLLNKMEEKKKIHNFAENNSDNEDMGFSANSTLNTERLEKIFTKKDSFFLKRFVKSIETKIEEDEINITFSGSTFLLLFIIGKRLTCINIGDSRCILFKCSSNNKWSYIKLSNEHIAANEEEKKRIIERGGEVHPCKDINGESDGIDRVWVKGKVYPGLAISRSIGDLCGRRVGIIPEPEIIKKKLDKRSKFLVLGSDGFWDLLTPFNIITVVKPFLLVGDANGASKALVSKACEFWSKSSDERDDITAIVIFVELPIVSNFEDN